jgi:hypothetical protein
MIFAFMLAPYLFIPARREHWIIERNPVRNRHRVIGLIEPHRAPDLGEIEPAIRNAQAHEDVVKGAGREQKAGAGLRRRPGLIWQPKVLMAAS